MDRRGTRSATSTSTTATGLTRRLGYIFQVPVVNVVGRPVVTLVLVGEHTAADGPCPGVGRGGGLECDHHVDQGVVDCSEQWWFTDLGVCGASICRWWSHLDPGVHDGVRVTLLGRQ